MVQDSWGKVRGVCSAHLETQGLLLQGGLSAPWPYGFRNLVLSTVLTLTRHMRLDRRPKHLCMHALGGVLQTRSH